MFLNGFMISLVVFFAAACLVTSQENPSVLQSLAQGEPAGEPYLSDSEAAQSLFNSWYPASYQEKFAPTSLRDDADAGKTYGELEPQGIDMLLDRVADFGAPLGENDVFADLGSGVGQVAMFVFLKAFPKRVIGVELLSERHELAVQARENAWQALATLSSKRKKSELNFVEGNFLDSSKWADATVAYTCSYVFPKELIEDLREAMVKALKPGAMVFSLAPLGGDHKELAPVDVVNAKVSWDSGRVKVFVYIRNLDPKKLKQLNSAVAESQSVYEDCVSWGTKKRYFATSELLMRFCYAFAWKWDERAQFGQFGRVDYDWVLSEL